MSDDVKMTGIVVLGLTLVLMSLIWAITVNSAVHQESDQLEIQMDMKAINKILERSSPR